MAFHRFSSSFHRLGIVFIVPEDPFNDVWELIIPTIIVAFCYLIIFLCLPCYYEIDGKYLRIRSGIIVKRDLLIPEIREVKDSHDPITAPAMSLKRICITTKGGLKHSYHQRIKKSLLLLYSVSTLILNVQSKTIHERGRT